MNILNFLISNYGVAILGTILTGLVTYLGVVLKNILVKFANSKEKKDVAKTVVTSVEQIYKDLHGDEKLDKALSSLKEMLAEKGITISDLEARVLIESAVGELNDVFKKAIADDSGKTDEPEAVVVEEVEETEAAEEKKESKVLAE